MENVYIHKKTGNEYWLVDNGKFKDGDHWVDCVIYVSRGTGKNDVYVRRLEDFKTKFVKKDGK